MPPAHRDGRLVGIDRSAVAVRRARERNAADMSAGKVVFHQLGLEEYDGDEAPFDKVFAFNVNVFWTDPSGPGLGVIKGVLRPTGTLHLFWDQPPGSARARLIAEKVTKGLTGHGFTATALTAPFAFGLAARVTTA